MTWQVLNPYDQECIGSVELVDWPQIDRWLDDYLNSLTHPQ